jgi:hypothetical protein
MHEAIANIGSVLSPNACVTRLRARLVSDRGVVGTCDSYNAIAVATWSNVWPIVFPKRQVLHCACGPSSLGVGSCDSLSPLYLASFVVRL